MAIKAKSVSFAAKPTSKSNTKGKGKVQNEERSKAKQVEPEQEESESESSDEDEDQDVSQRGLERLMKALGDDGLSDLDKAHLGFVTGQLDDDEGSEEEEEDDEVDEEIDDFEVDDEEDDEEEDEEGEGEDIDEIPQATARSGDSLAASIARSGLVQAEEDDEDEDEEEEDEDIDSLAIPLESLSDAALAALPESVRATRQYREKINNEDALLRIRDSIALVHDGKALPWIETLSVAYPKSIQEELGDSAEAAEDDLKRELEFYKQALHAAIEGRKLADQVNLPFTRPSDYFAEMVKSDEHMERVRQKLLDEKAGLKASEDARKQRELKKFGKKVQVEKQLERQRNKREFEEKVKGLKRKRNGAGLDGADDDGGDDDFDVRLESAMEGGRKQERGGSNGNRRGGKQPKMKRDVRDSKYGFGGKKRHSKENTRESLDEGFGGGRRGGRGGSARGGRGGRGGFSSRGSGNRPGKARRASGRK